MDRAHALIFSEKGFAELTCVPIHCFSRYFFMIMLHNRSVDVPLALQSDNALVSNGSQYSSI